MKKFYSLVLMAAALLIGTNVWAADVTVVNETTGASKSYDGSTALQSAIDFIGAGQTGTITLNNPITLDAAVVMPHVTGTINAATNPTVLNRTGQNITLNLNGKTITGANAKGVILIFKGSLDITGTGEITHAGAGVNDNTKNYDRSAITIYGAPWSKKDQVWSTLTIGENVTVKTGDDVDKVYGLCIQNTSASPLTEATLGYLTYYAKANAPAEACQNGLKNLGCAYGVKVFVNGKVYGHMRGINVLGTINAAPKCEIGENITQRQYDAYPYYDYNYPYVNIGSTAQVWCVNDGVANDNNGGIYGGGYAVYDISGTVYGQTGIYLKSGDLKLTDANIYSTATTVGTSADYHSGKTAGAGIFIGSDAGYAGGQNVELEGDTKVSGGSDPAANGIIDVVATNAQSTGSSVSHVTVEGGTIEGGINLTSTTSTVTTVYGAQITGEIVVDGDTTTVATITPSGTHVTEVTINGKPTIVVSEGEGPADEAKKTTWNEIAALSNKNAPADVAWTAVGEGTISSNLYFGELQMISGTDASNIQKLTINNGATLNVKHLMMNNFAQIIVEPGAKLIVNGEQGIVAPVVSNIVLKNEGALDAADRKHATFLFNPAVTSNRHPNATVELTTYSYSNSGTDYQWERFGVPTHNALKSITTSSSVATAFSAFIGTSWQSLGFLNATPAVNSADFNKPFITYELIANRTYDPLNPTVGPKYEFAGELVGNDDAVLNVNNYWTPFTNSYSADLSVSALLNVIETAQIVDHYIYIGESQGMGKYAWNILDLDEEDASTTKLAPMQAFLLKKVQGSTQTEDIALSYKNMVYAPATSASAPRRRVASDDFTARAKVVVVDENGRVLDNVKLRETASRTKEAEKYMNDDVNIYAKGDVQAAIFAVEDLNNSYLGFSAVSGGTYTLTFANVSGREFDIIDLETGARINVAEGSEYTFTTAANYSNEYRFKIVEREEVATDIENTEAVKNVKGIYTITGQYVGEMNVWNTLPAGVYVVDGAKRVK